MPLRYIYMMVCMVLLSVSGIHAERVSIKAKLDSAHLVMGKSTTLHLEIVKDRGTTGYFPIFADGDNRPYVGVLGDTIELSRNMKSDTVDLGSGRMQVNYRIPLQAFDSGFYYLPPLQYVSGIDTVQSNRVALKVLPINVAPDSNIEGYTDVEEPTGVKWTDKIPDVLVDYWWLILLIVLVLAAVIGGYIYYRKNGVILPKLKPELSPYEAAMKSLKELHDEQLWQKGFTEKYFVELINILRIYIDRRFNVSAPEMTTQQFLLAASENPRLASHASELRRLLELADFVKFARGQSLPDENTEAYNVVSEFITGTKPSQEEEAARKAEVGKTLRQNIRKEKGTRKLNRRNNSSGRVRGRGGKAHAVKRKEAKR